MRNTKFTAIISAILRLRYIREVNTSQIIGKEGNVLNDFKQDQQNKQSNQTSQNKQKQNAENKQKQSNTQNKKNDQKSY